MFLVLLILIVLMAVAMAIGFVLGRIWQIRCDLEQERAGVFTAPPIAHIPLVAKRPYEAPVR
jgi:hypothetical protein